MKELIQWATVMLIVTMIFGVIPTEAEGEIYEDTLRLHILANSDSKEDQDLKIMIRDRILLEYGTALQQGQSVDEAKAQVGTLLHNIEESAEKWIKEFGYNYPVSATLGEEWYERREYDDFTLPAGKYASLKIIIGDGKGKNWWCVMYPPLCMELATESAPADDGYIDYTKEEVLLITSDGYNIKFKILEELSRAFAKNG